MECAKKWPVIGMVGLASPVIVTKHQGIQFNITEDDLQKMLDEVNEVLKKHGHEIDKITNARHLHVVENKAAAIDSLKRVLND